MPSLVDGFSSSIPNVNDRISSVPTSTALIVYTNSHIMRPCAKATLDNQIAGDANITKIEELMQFDSIDTPSLSTLDAACINGVEPKNALEKEVREEPLQLVDQNTAVQNELQLENWRPAPSTNSKHLAPGDAIIKRGKNTNKFHEFKRALRTLNIDQVLKMLQAGDCSDVVNDKIRNWLAAKVWIIRREESCIRSVMLSLEHLLRKYCTYLHIPKCLTRAAKVWKFGNITRKEQIVKLIKNIKMEPIELKENNVQLLESESTDPITNGKMLTRASRKAKLFCAIPQNSNQCLVQQRPNSTREEALRNTFDEELCGICCELEDEEGSNLVVWCKKSCYTAYHLSCLGLTDEFDDSEWKCEQCENREQICFACGRNGSIDERGGVFKCCSQRCHKFYHYSCVEGCRRTRFYGSKRKRNPQIRKESDNLSMESDTNEEDFKYKFKFRCPRHICAVCEDAKSSELMFCIKCPESYHTSCVPPSARYNTVGLLCYRHRHDDLPRIPSHWYTDLKMAIVTVDCAIKFPDLFLPATEPIASNTQDRHHFRIPADYLVRVHTRPPPYRKLTRNLYTFKQLRPPFEDVPTCVCTERCGDGCINRLSFTECFGPAPTEESTRNNQTFNCHVGEHCGNRALHQRVYPRTELFHSFDKGFALRAKESIQAGQLVMEYVGEVINEQEKDRRLEEHARKHPQDRNMYIMELGNQIYIDARFRGSVSRFINHSCDPNCHLVKWRVCDLDRIAISALRDIKPEEELSYDYRFYTSEALQWKCFCKSAKCRGTMAPEITCRGKSKQKRLLHDSKLSETQLQKRLKRTSAFENTIAMQVIVGGKLLVDEMTIQAGPDEIELSMARQHRFFLPRNATRGANFLLRKLLKELQKERKLRQDEECSEDDTFSQASREIPCTSCTEYMDDKQSITFHSAIEKLTDGSFGLSDRIEALRQLLSELAHVYRTDQLPDSLITAVLDCLEKPSQSECSLGAHIVEIIAFIMGPHQELFYSQVNKVLKPLVKSRSEEIQSASLRALGITFFVCSEGHEDSMALLNLLEDRLYPEISGDVCTASLQSLGRVISTISEEEMVSEDLAERFLPLLTELLDHTDVNVRSSAGENIAFLYQHVPGVAYLAGHTMLVQKILEMSKESSKKKTKKDRKTQRLVFRDVYATLANGDLPITLLTVRGDRVELEGWEFMLQLESMKRSLGSGLQQQLEHNNFIRKLFDLPEVIEYSIIDRRDVFDKRSQSKKQRSNNLKGDRRRKQHLQNAMLGE
uniref:Histonelysine Nmethyltransferase putative n=1 Tax=Albugo laibachii Nc14 TaxID=890382 RepID=F0W2M4_9STRA|nr:histonelysine Nmethyltransferase putative [Albugo laibachii Nc14]|eukprot:CCA15310.1 histonelysine Nmethyltransferase putative [Albugo laibachii Nc14]